MINDFPPLVEHIPHGSGLCLDIGCGYTAPYRHHIERKGYTWVGVDIDLFSKHIKNGGVMADAHNLPFKDGAINVVFSNQMLLNLHSPKKAVEEIQRVLCKGGRFYGKTSLMECFNNSYFHMTHLGLNKILTDAGFKVVNIWPGANVFYLLYWHLFFHRTLFAKIASVINQVVISGIMGIHELFYFLRNRKRSTHRKSFNETFDLYYAAHIGFVAEKQ